MGPGRDRYLAGLRNAASPQHGVHVRLRLSTSMIDLATLLSALSAFIVAGLLVRREFVAPARRLDQLEAPPKMVSNWNRLIQGQRMGPPNARIVVVEFADFECPFCREYVSVLDDLARKYPGEVAFVFQHFPLRRHRFALPAAQAAECAANQGKFSEMYRRIYAAQDSLGLIPFTDLARSAGVRDSQAFASCMSSPQAPAIARGIALGKEVGVQGTPSVVINGLSFSKLPANAVIDSIARVALRESHR